MKKQITEFLQKVMKVRKYTLQHYKCRRNAYAMAGYMAEIQRWLDYNAKHSTDWQASQWLINNKGLINIVMPGYGSASHEGLKKQLETLLVHSQLFLNHGPASSVLHQPAA